MALRPPGLGRSDGRSSFEDQPPGGEAEIYFAESFEALLRDFTFQVLGLYEQCQATRNANDVGAGTMAENRDGLAIGPVQKARLQDDSDDIDLEKNGAEMQSEGRNRSREDSNTSGVTFDPDPMTHEVSNRPRKSESGESDDNSNRTERTSFQSFLQKSKRTNIVNLERIPHLVDKIHGRESIRNAYEQFIFSGYYVIIVTVAVVTQASCLGVEVSLEMEYQNDRIQGRPLTAIPKVVHVINYALLVFFLLEVIFRVLVLRTRFFFPTDPDAQGWNLFDLFIVIACVPDFVPGVYTLSDMPFIHAIRLLRVIRILRVARGITALRKMVFALMHCMSSLLWLVALMFLLLYMFALAFMQGAASDMEKMETAQEYEDSIARLLISKGEGVLEGTRLLATKSKGTGTACNYDGPHPYSQFSNIGATMQSLFQMVTGDADWDHTMKKVEESNWFYKCLGFFFSVFFFFGFMNVATGLFVDRAMQIAQQDREMIMKEATQKEKEEMQAMKELFQAADLDGDGDLTLHELHEVISHPDVRSWLATIDLDIVPDFEAVAMILDPTGKGYIQADEFYSIIGRFRGPARKLETTLLLMEARMNHKAFHQFHQHHNVTLDKAIEHLEEHGKALTGGRSGQRLSRQGSISPLSRLGTLSSFDGKNGETELGHQTHVISMKLRELEQTQSKLQATIESVFGVPRFDRLDKRVLDDGSPNKDVKILEDKLEMQVDRFVDGDLKKLGRRDSLSNCVTKLVATQSRLRKQKSRTGQQGNDNKQESPIGSARSQEQWERENKKQTPVGRLRQLLTPRLSTPSGNLLATPQLLPTWPRTRSPTYIAQRAAWSSLPPSDAHLRWDI